MKNEEEKKFDVAEMRMLKWMSGVTKLDRMRNVYLDKRDVTQGCINDVDMCFSTVNSRFYNSYKPQQHHHLGSTHRRCLTSTCISIKQTGNSTYYVGAI